MYGAHRRGRRPGRRACALWFHNFSTWDGVAGRLPGGPVRAARSSAGTAWPARCCPRWPRECVDNGYTRLSWAVLDWNVNAIALYDAVGGAAAERVDHLPGVGPRVVGAGAASPEPRQPLHRRRAEQQHQRRQRRRADRDAVEPLAASRRRCTRPPAAAAVGRTPRSRGPTAGRSTAPSPPRARRRR